LKSSPFFQQLFSGADIGTNSGFLAILVFNYLPLIVAIFAGIMAYRWATDLDKGRMELVLGTPPSRWRVLLARYTAVLVAAVGMSAFVWLAIVLFAQASSFTIDVGRVAAASFGMLPLELVTASLVFALAGLVPPGAVMGLMSAFVGVSFLAEILKALLKLPDWVVNLSIFHQYGNPVMEGLSWGPFVGMLLAAAVLLGLGGLQFTRRDVDRGAIEA
jgi:ABC-2 type transport system permease protein